MAMLAERPGRGASSGFALIVVLWFLAVIALIAAQVAGTGRSEIALARNTLEAARAEALADAAVARALFNLVPSDLPDRWWPDGQARPLRMTDGEAVVTVWDEGARINPNLATPQLVAGLLEAVGADRSLATRIAAAVTEQKASGSASPAAGTPPASAGNPGRPSPDADAPSAPAGADGRNKPAGSQPAPGEPPVDRRRFDTIDDLTTIDGMSPSLLDAARPYLSLYTDREVPDARFASPVIQSVLAAVVGRAGRAQPASEPTTVRIIATARSRGGGVFVREAVYRVGGSRTVLAWSRLPVVPAP